MKTNMRIGGALLAAVTFLGCKETTSSEFIRTGGIAALMSVGAESGDAAKVRVELKVGGRDSNTYVILDGGDKLIAKAGTESKDMYSVGEGVYEAELAQGGQVDFTVSLDREEDEDAPNSRVTLPAAFTIAQPQPGDTLSRADDGLLIAWTPVAEVTGTVSLSGSCIQSASYDVAGSAGTLVVGPGELKSTDEMMPEGCTVEIVISFAREGVADPAYDEESYIRASQTRRASYFSDP
jgi:hypothetical protein